MTKIITSILDTSAVQLVLPAKIEMLHPNPTNLTTTQNNFSQPNRVRLMAKNTTGRTPIYKTWHIQDETPWRGKLSPQITILESSRKLVIRH